MRDMANGNRGMTGVTEGMGVSAGAGGAVVGSDRPAGVGGPIGLVVTCPGGVCDGSGWLHLSEDGRDYRQQCFHGSTAVAA